MRDYEEAVLIALFDEKIIGSSYKPIEKAARKINWGGIARKYDVKKSFKKVLQGLARKGVVSDHGKSGRVVSLTLAGLAYLRSELEV
ncbi:MAG: hypothetical protein KAW41_03930 [Candidatus Diapherotrites archaeon]|nr:hypothetical protein [Candidatus Diapherotrites archaeon]